MLLVSLNLTQPAFLPLSARLPPLPRFNHAAPLEASRRCTKEVPAAEAKRWPSQATPSRRQTRPHTWLVAHGSLYCDAQWAASVNRLL